GVAPSLFILHVSLASHPSDLFFRPPVDHRYLHSFPTRRSSDLYRICRPSGGVASPRYGNAGSKIAVPIWVAGIAGRLPSPPISRSEEQRLNSSHQIISYAVFCLKKKRRQRKQPVLREAAS